MKFIKLILLTSAFAMLSVTSFAQSAEQGKETKNPKRKVKRFTTREECRSIVRAKLINASQAPSRQIKRTVEDICRRSSNLNP